MRPTEADALLYPGLRSVVEQASALVHHSNIDHPDDDTQNNEGRLSLVGQYIATLGPTLSLAHLSAALLEQEMEMDNRGQKGQPSLSEAVKSASVHFDPIHFIPTGIAVNGPHWDAVYNVGKGDVFHGFGTHSQGPSAMSEWLQTKVA